MNFVFVAIFLLTTVATLTDGTVDDRPTTIVAPVTTNHDDDGEFFSDSFDNSIDGNLLQTLFDVRLLVGSIFDAYRQLSHDQRPPDAEPWRIYRQILDQIGTQVHNLGLLALKFRNDEITDACAISLATMLDDLRSSRLWAWRMLDATGLGLHAGITGGPLVNLGAYDQCLAVADGAIRGQYCLVEMSVPRIFGDNADTQRPPPPSDRNWNATIWSELFAMRSYLDAGRIYVSICLPAQCSEQEVRHAVKWLRPDDQNLSVRCQTDASVDGTWIRTGALALLAGINIVIAVSVVATIVAFFVVRRRRLLHPHSPSVLRWRRQQPATDLSRSPVMVDGPEPAGFRYRPLAGIQVAILTLTLHWHTILFTRKMTMHQVLQYLEPNPGPAAAVRYLTLGWPLMDAWMTADAIHHSYRLLRDPAKTVLGRVAWLLADRWTAVAAITVAATILLPVFARGPLSPLILPHCRQWWQPLLLLFPIDIHCLPHLWPVAVELQLYPTVLVPTALLLAWRRPSITRTIVYAAFAILAHGLLLSVAFYLRRWTDIRQLAMVTAERRSEMAILAELLKWNTGAWLHVAPYLIGSATGYLLASGCFTSTKINRRLIIVTMAAGTTVGILAAGSWCLDQWLRQCPSCRGQPLLASIWLGMHRPVCSLLIAALVILANQNGTLAGWLSNPIMQSLATIRHQWYLWHYVVLVGRDARRRQPLYLSHWTMMEETIINATFSLILACICQRLLARPIVRYIRIAWQNYRQRRCGIHSRNLNHHHHHNNHNHHKPTDDNAQLLELNLPLPSPPSLPASAAAVAATATAITGDGESSCCC